MARLLIAPAAERDIEQILRWTHQQFGELARKRYESLLFQAIRDILEEPLRFGVSPRPEIEEHLLTYHLWYSRNRTMEKSRQVKSPRHFLLIRIRDEDQIEICRVLHDSMDLPRHLPEDLSEGSDDTSHD